MRQDKPDKRDPDQVIKTLKRVISPGLPCVINVIRKPIQTTWVMLNLNSPALLNTKTPLDGRKHKESTSFEGKKNRLNPPQDLKKKND